MSSLSLGTGLKALLSARYVLDTVGHNLANANTPGYSRQRVSLQSSLALPARGLLVGSGVDIGRIERSVDELLSRRINTQRSALGGLDARLTGLSELESFFGATGESTLSGLFDGFYSSVSDLATAPADSILRNNLVQSSRTLTSRFHEIDSRLAVVERDTLSEVRSRVNEVNGRAAEIALLNVEVSEAQSSGISPNDLLDRRDFLIRELSELVDISTVTASNGSLSVLVGGNTLVGSTRAAKMSAVSDDNGDIRIKISGSEGYIPVTGGAVGGLLELAGSDVVSLRGNFDALAHEMILAVNRSHSTGVPATGSFSILTGSNRVADFDGDGKATDELLSNSGLPFDVTSGSLFINVESKSTGAIEKSKIEITATHTTVQDFLDEVSAIDHLTADIDASGRVRLVADSGFGFDFSSRLSPIPDSAGTFGGKHASLGTASAEPYGLADGDTLAITVAPGGVPSTFSITFDQADFVEISQATAKEIADAINADAGAQGNGIVATSVDGTLVVQTLSEGTTANLSISGGTSVAALGWTGALGNTVQGHANSVDPRITGTYTGSKEGSFTFRPNMDGTIGTTDGLSVDVFDEEGELVTSLIVGTGYVPGTELVIADGVQVSFGLGDLEASNGDLFSVGLVPNSDTTDVLVALGLNGFFEGSDASSIEVRQDIMIDPNLVATSIDGASGDSSVLLDLLSVKEMRVGALGDASIGQFYGEIISELGFQAASTADALNANGAVIQSLELRRDQASGVDVDEELIDLVAFEQAFQAASRFISVVSQLDEELLALI